MEKEKENKKSVLTKLVGDPEKFTLEHRIFNAACLTAIIAGIFSFIVNIALGLNIVLTLSVLSVVIIYFFTYRYSMRKEKYQMLVFPFTAFGILILGYMWFINAGLDGTVMSFVFVSSVIFFSISKKGYRKYSIIAVVLLVTILLYVEYNYPGFIKPYPDNKLRYLDHYFSSVILLFILGLVVGVIFDGYDDERKRVIRQRDEISKKSEELEAIKSELEAHKINLEQLVAERTEKLKEINEQLEYEILEHKKTTLELRKNEATLRSIFDNSLNAILKTNLNGDILYFNAAALKIFGFPDGESLSTMNIFSMLQDNIFENVNETEKVEKFTGVNRFVFKRYNNNVFPAECSSGYIPADTKEPASFVVIISDISEREKIERELIATKEKAEESDRLKSAFLSNMSHEIRTPMNAILGFSKLLYRKDLTEMARNRYLSIINEKGKYLLSIINDIIDISKVETGALAINFKVFQVDEVMQDLYYTFSNIKRKKNKENIELRYKFEIGTRDISINADPVRFKQIMTNLLDNAIKFTDTGYVEFGFKVIKKKEGKFASFYVKDTGCGISEEHQEVIFGRFLKIEEVPDKLYEGTGLGLTISQKLAGRMNTRIYLESKKGKGSTFYFELPVVNRKTIKKEKKTKMEKEKNKDWSGKKIMIVDNELTGILLLKEYLKPTGANIITAGNGVEAVDKINAGEIPDLILMDLRMPKMDGYEATKIIKKDHPGIIIIAQTAYAMIGDEEKAKRAGCDDFITKPISVETLLDKLSVFIKNTDS